MKQTRHILLGGKCHGKTVDIHPQSDVFRMPIRKDAGFDFYKPDMDAVVHVDIETEDYTRHILRVPRDRHNDSNLWRDWGWHEFILFAHHKLTNEQVLTILYYPKTWEYRLEHNIPNPVCMLDSTPTEKPWREPCLS